MKNLKPTIYAFTLLSVMVACSQETELVRSEPAIEASATAGAGTETRSDSGIVAVLHPTDGNRVSGTVMFSETEAGVSVNANIVGLPAMSTHGFHLHEFGDCSAADASSAGGHFNPAGEPHGGPDSQPRHLGDLGNLTSNSAGIAQTEKVFTGLAFAGANSIVGRAVVIHADADDLESQPTGNAGARLACGVIVKP